MSWRRSVCDIAMVLSYLCRHYVYDIKSRLVIIALVDI